MKKIKHLLPTLREKNRYLAFEVLSETPLKQEEVNKGLSKSVLSLNGELGTGEMGFHIHKELYNKEQQNSSNFEAQKKPLLFLNQQKGIAKTTHKGVDRLKASLALIENMENQPVIARSIGVSGTLTKAKRYLA